MGDDEGKNDGEQQAEAPGDELAEKRKGKKKRAPKKPKADGDAAVAPKGRKGKQLQIEGTERHERIPEIEEAAERYAEVRDTRMEWTKKEVQARELVRGLMKKHQLQIYECDGEDLTVELLPAGEEKVKVKRRESGEDDVDGDDAGEGA